MSNIVVTGARGYIGRALTNQLASEGHTLRLVSRSLSVSKLGSMPSVEHRATDLRHPQNWSDLLRDVEVVVHISSRTDLRAAEADPVVDKDINVRPLRALVEAARRAHKQPRVIFASAVTIVGPHPQLPANETAPDRPCSNYDRHKLLGETILREATAYGSVRSCSLRLSNVYGYGGASINADRGILNTMMKRAIAGEPLTLYGNGAYMRDFVHVEDVVEAFRRAIVAPEVCDGEHYVIASGRGRALAEAYELIAEVAMEQLERRVEIVRVREPADLHPIEKRNFIGDSRLFRTRTGWWPIRPARRHPRLFSSRRAPATAN